MRHRNVIQVLPACELLLNPLIAEGLRVRVPASELAHERQPLSLQTFIIVKLVFFISSVDFELVVDIFDLFFVLDVALLDGEAEI